VTQAGGRREQHKQHTRAALQAAADRLFIERGYQQTTVRDIAQACGVTERTFFRYFAAKEELALSSAMAWLGPVCEAIQSRPPAEDAVTAVQQVLIQTEAAMRASQAPTLLSLYADRAPAEFLGSVDAGRPRLLVLALERSLAVAIRVRLLIDGAPDDGLLDYRSSSLARTCVALMRSALLHDLQLRRSGAPDRPSLSELIDLAFDDLRRGWRP